MSANEIYSPGTAFADAVVEVRAGTDPRTSARALVGQLSDVELLGLLDGDLPVRKGIVSTAKRYNAVPYVAGHVPRLGIPGIRFTDGPRGVVMGASTSFPVPVARAATWDTALEERIGAAIGAEARAQGANFFGGVCVNVAPAPGWGRSQESYGDEPVLVGAMGAALVTGTRPWVMSCVKHFALNSMEESRFVVDVHVDDTTLHEMFLPHFKAAIDANADAVMTAYNSVNGEWAGQNTHLLDDILRGQWGFTGIVITDFVWGLRDPVASVAAGQDIEMPFAQQRARTLPGALARGALDRRAVVRAAERIVATQLAFAARAEAAPDASVVACHEHRALAREAAAQAIVMLKNDTVDDAPILPFTGEGTVVLAGSRATTSILGDVGSSRVRPPDEATVLDGLTARLGNRVRYVANEYAVAAATGADHVVLAVGLDARDEGEALVALDDEALMVFGGPFRSRRFARGAARVLEKLVGAAAQGGDRRDLHLHADDVDLIRAVARVNPRTVVVVIGGGTVMCDPWDDEVAGILLAWYPGMAGGHAIADVLVGDAEPGGRLPAPIPRVRGDLPEVGWLTRGRLDYPSLCGQRLLDRMGVPAAYPLGFGLGYTGMRLTEAVLRDGPIIGVSVVNPSARAGREVIQVYATQTADQDRLPRVLVGFAAVPVPANTHVTVDVVYDLHPLDRWRDNVWHRFNGDVTLEISRYAGDPDALTLACRR